MDPIWRTDFSGEPPLRDLIQDPMLQAMLARSGTNERKLLDLMATARKRLAAAHRERRDARRVSADWSDPGQA